jgi:hypothetical protein
MRLETHGAEPRQYLFGLWKYLVEGFRNYVKSGRVFWLLFKVVDRQVLKFAQRPFRKARTGTTQEIGSSWSNFAAHEIKRVPKLTKYI